jgi:AcrR family transcriptional regulator
MAHARSGRPKKGSNRDTRKELLQAAFELFSQHGISQVNLTDIAERAGVSIGLIRHYFGSKDGLVDECTQVVMDQLREIFRQILDGSGPREGTAFIDHLRHRTTEAFTGHVGLLKYLRQLTIENAPVANEAFKDYFLLLQQELNRIEAAGHLRGDANKTWLTFHIMYMQMGPVFLSEQIEAIIGMPSHSPEAVRERGRENARILKYGILANPAPREP